MESCLLHISLTIHDFDWIMRRPVIEVAGSVNRCFQCFIILVVLLAKEQDVLISIVYLLLRVITIYK